VEAIRAIREINSGIYCAEAAFLYPALKKIGRNNDQGEYYLPDIIALAIKEGKLAAAAVTDDFQEVKGLMTALSWLKQIRQCASAFSGGICRQE